MLNFPQNSLASHLEAFLEKTSNPGDQELFIPPHLYLDGGLGSATHAAQAIAQISRNATNGLAISTDKELLESLQGRKDFTESPHGTAALYFASQALIGEKVVSSHDLKQMLTERLLATRSQNYKTSSGTNSSSLSCLIGSRNEFMPSIYSGNAPGTVRSRSEFIIAFRRMLSNLGKEASEFLTEGAENYLNTLVRELFLNADEHGSIDADGNRLRRGMRGIHMQVTSLDAPDDTAREAGDDNAVRLYLASLPLQGNFESHDAPKLLEMSVFDTGPGMGLSWLSRSRGARSHNDFDSEEELDAVKTCFKKQATTRSSIIRGQGLPTVLRALNKMDAFMTVRTGRTSIYQDFSLRDSDEFSPYQRFLTKKLPLISGTSFTIWFRIK